jgi:hypothetical protein
MRPLYASLSGRDKKHADQIIKHSDKILGGTMLAIDPSSTSMGWALFVHGEVYSAGTAKSEGSVGERLAEIMGQLPDENLDVLVTEFVRSSTGHIYLVWSNGAAVAKYGPPVVLEVTTGAWKKLVDKSYVKTDVRDATNIGTFAVQLCKEYKDEHS